MLQTSGWGRTVEVLEQVGVAAISLLSKLEVWKLKAIEIASSCSL
jgi:hypothetical protein